MNRRSLMTKGNFKTRNENSQLIIEGYFAVFNSPAAGWAGYVEQIDPHAFDGELDKDVRALLDHQTHLVLGRTKAGTLELSVDEKGLFGKIVINPEDSEAVNAYERVKRGDIDQCSFGFDIVDEEYETQENGDVLCTIKKVVLYEVSVCTFPFYSDTEVSARNAEVGKIKNHVLSQRKAQLKKRLEEFSSAEADKT